MALVRPIGYKFESNVGLIPLLATFSAAGPQADTHFLIITKLMWPTKEGAELSALHGITFS